jgi:hypothetical protein
MGDRHHHVAQFHLRGFADPSSLASPEPWLWFAGCADGEVRRRAPKYLGWERALYDVPGAFSTPDAGLEEHLAQNDEAPAAAALRECTQLPAGSRGCVPPAVMRYLAWAAARTPAMRDLYQEWIDNGTDSEAPVVEQPPAWLEFTSDRDRPHRMEHPTHVRRDDVHANEVQRLRSEGWRFLVAPNDFGELLHVRAHYFYDRFFPRLQWLILDAPKGVYFVIGDRPVVWGFADALDVQPAALRHRNARIVAPLTRSVALFGFNPAGDSPTAIRVDDVNRASSTRARDWIAGPTQSTVLSALAFRTSSLGDHAIQRSLQQTGDLRTARFARFCLIRPQLLSSGVRRQAPNHQ